jgi:hypothetical protein
MTVYELRLVLLLAFGAGMGFSAVSPWTDSGVSATTFKVGTGLYLIVAAMIASMPPNNAVGVVEGAYHLAK